MGISLYSSDDYTRNAVQPNVWHRSYDPRRDWRTLSPSANPWSWSKQGKPLSVGLDLINELRDKCRIREEACKIRAARRYNSKVKPRLFHKGDLVWRMRSGARKEGGKFSSNWEGPFRITDTVAGGAYYLEHLSGKDIPRTWNATHLKFYYSWN